MEEQSEHIGGEWLSLAVALLGGYADAIGYVLANTFTGHITGNTVLAAISLVQQDWATALRRALAVAIFLLGIALNSGVARWATRRTGIPLSVELFFEAALFLAAGLGLGSHLRFHSELFVVCMCVALGFQNGSLRNSKGVSVHTTYMTGMMTRFVERAFDAPHARSRDRGNDPASRLLLSLWLWFAAGAVAGAAAAIHWRARSVIPAAVLLVCLSLAALVVERRASAQQA